MIKLNLDKEKISSPAAGLNARNPRDSVDGAHAVPRWGTLAAFSHPRNPRISRIPSALIATVGRNFLPFQGRIPFAGRGVGEAARIGIFLPPGPRRARPTQTVSHLVLQLPNHLLLSYLLPTFGKNQPCFLDPGSNRRPSVRGRRRDSALSAEGGSTSGGQER